MVTMTTSRPQALEKVDGPGLVDFYKHYRAL